MRRMISLYAIVFMAAPVAAQPAGDATMWADSAQRAIEAAYLTGEPQAVAEARALVERALVRFPDDAMLLHYLGHAHYREANLLQGQGGEGAAEHLDQAEKALERAAALHQLPETSALLGSVLGQKIGSNPIRGMTLGPRSGSLMEKAERAAPENPRVWLLQGISAIFTPGMFGGGLDRAEAHLKRALELFEKDQPAPPLPAWGRDEAWVWLGQVYERRKMPDQALQAYRKALEIEPRNAWVSEVLLPALERK